jgi:hypothetical protein
MMNPQDDAQSPPSGATAVTAGVLALVGAIYWAFELWAGLLSVYHRSDPTRIVTHDNGKMEIYPAGIWIGWTVLAEVALATGLLLSGGILLLMRKPVGRWLIVIGCGAALAALLHPLFASSYWYRSFPPREYFFALFPVLTAALALAPSTKRWCTSSRRGRELGESPDADGTATAD